MGYNEELQKPQSPKNTLVEIDTPLSATWINHVPGVWFTTLTPGSQDVIDDRGNVGYWEGRNEVYYNIQSFNVDGVLYDETANINDCISTEETWYYDNLTTRLYVHFVDHDPPERFSIISPGAVIGFSMQINKATNNFFEDVYYEPLLISVPNLTKKKDTTFFGILQYSGGSVSFDNTGGYFDNFAQLDLYGQPIRVILTFEGLDYDDAEVVYSGKVEDFTHDLTTFKLNIADIRKLFTRKLPVNLLINEDYPNMDDRLDGTPIPIAFGDIIKAPAYRTSSGNWTFCDTEFNAVDSGIIVYNEDDTIFSHSGTGTNGTFTGATTTDKLTVSFSVSVIENGLDIISDILENYEGTDYNSFNYDTTEWTAERANVANAGIWLGKGNLKTAIDIIEQICTDNQGIFDVLADGKFTFRTFDADRTPTYEIMQDELIDDTSIIYDRSEYASSIKVEYSVDLKEKAGELYTNSEAEAEGYGRYRTRNEQEFTEQKRKPSALTSLEDVQTLTDRILDQSRFIYPILNLKTKTQNIGMRVLDNILYTFQRQNGNVIMERSRCQVLGTNINLSTYEMGITIKQIEEDDTTYLTLEGGDSETDYDYYDGGNPSSELDNIIDGGGV